MVSGLFRSVKCSAMTFVREGRFASPASNRSIGIVEIVDEGKPESHRPKLPHHARAGSGDTGMTIGCSRIDRASASPSRYAQLQGRALGQIAVVALNGGRVMPAKWPSTGAAAVSGARARIASRADRCRSSAAIRGTPYYHGRCKPCRAARARVSGSFSRGGTARFANFLSMPCS